VTKPQDAINALDELKRVADEIDERRKLSILLSAINDEQSNSAQAKGARSALWSSKIQPSQRLTLAAASIINGDTMAEAIAQANLSGRVKDQAARRWVASVKETYKAKVNEETLRRVELSGKAFAEGDLVEMLKLLAQKLAAETLCLIPSYSGMTANERHVINRTVSEIGDAVKAVTDQELKSAQRDKIHVAVKRMLEDDDNTSETVKTAARDIMNALGGFMSSKGAGEGAAA